MNQKKISIQIVIHNNEATIGRLIDSIQSLNPQIIVANLGCTDRTVEICEGRGACVFNLEGEKRMDNIRNRLIGAATKDWNLWMEPWEVLVDASMVGSVISQPAGACSMRVLNGGMVTYETRLWHKSLNYQFCNPVAPYMDIPEANVSWMNSSIYGDGSREMLLEVIHEWRTTSPAAPEPAYYEAFYHLAKQDWNNFINKAQQYLFDMKGATKASVMMKYYFAIAMCHIKKDIRQSLKHAVECVALRPLMAEFWCLLGDIFYHVSGEYKKAIQFYNNAIVLGSHRLYTDTWPMEIAKYGDYPKKMIASCRELLKSDASVVTIQRPSGSSG